MKALLKPINESLAVTVRPQLMRGFKTDLREKVKTAAAGIDQKVTFSPKLAAGFKTSLKTSINTATKDYTPAVAFAPALTATFKADLATAVETELSSQSAFSVEFAPKLRQGFTADLKMAVGGVKSKLRDETLIEFRPGLAKGFRADLKGKLETSTGTLRPKVPVDADLTQASAQLEAFRIAQAAVPLTMNVNIDTAAAVAQLMALRSLASAVGQETSGLGSGTLAGARRRLRGNIFTRPIRAIRLQIELDKASVARAEAEVANIRARLEQAQRRHGDAVDNTRLAQERYNEVAARANATDSQRTAALQRLTRARRDEADALGRVTGLMNQQRDADNRLDRARRDRNSISRLIGAGLSGLSSAIGDAARQMLSFRNLTNLAVIGLVALAAVSLVPLIGQLTQAAGVIGLLPAALTGAAAVIGTLVVGSQGIGDAFKAASKAAESAGEAAEQRAKSIASAQKQQATAARSVADAERGIATAERGVRDAQKNTLQAQKDLNRARKQAKDDIDDLNRALGRAALTEESAAIAVAEAQRELFQTFMDPNSDAIDRARAQNSVKQALADQQDTIRNNQKLAEQAAEANAKGIEGSDEVVAAKERVTDAIEAEQDAQQALADAHTRLADAQAAYVEAQQAVTDAVNESSSAADEYEKALGKLAPAARDFVEKMIALKEPFGELRRSVQQKLFDQMGDSVSRLARNWLPTLDKGLGGIAEKLNVGIRNALRDLATEASRNKMAVIFDNVAKAIEPALNGVTNLVQGFLSLSQVGSEFMLGGASHFENLTQRFREWAESPEGQSKFREFLSESLRTAKDILDVFREFGGVVNQIFRGSDDTGESWLQSMKETLARWNEFLGSPEGQQKIKDFFQDVKETVSAIVDLIEFAASLVDRMGFLRKPSEPEPRRTDAEGHPTDADGNRLDHENSWFPGVREGSIGDRILDGLGSASSFFGGSGFDRFKLREGQSPFEGILEGARRGWETQWEYSLKPKILESLSSVGTEFGGLAATFKERSGDMVGSLYEFATSAKTELVDNAGSYISDFKEDAGTKFNSFKTNVEGVFSYLTGPDVLGRFKDALNTLPGFFGTLVGGIASAWGRVSSALQGPINTVIDTLNSFGDIWNRVAKKLGLPEWEPIDHVGVTGQTGTFDKPLVGARAMGGPGGPVHGPGNGKDDRAGLYRLSRGEHVWTADEVRAAGGHEAMYRMRRTVLKGGGTQAKPDGPLPGYRDGGIVQTSDPLDPIQVHLWDLVRSAIPGAILTSAKRFVDVGSGYDLHMQGKAIDLGGPMKEIARWIYSTYPQSAELIHWPLDGWQNLDEGRPFDFGSGTNAQHRDHVHWAANDFLTEMSEDDKRSLFDRVRAGIGGLVSSGRSLMIDNLLAKPLRGLADQVPVFDQLGEFGQMPRAFARKMADAVIGWVTSRLGGESGGGVVDYDPAWGVEHWREMAKEAMRRVGFNADDETQVNAMLAQIKSESGGNPNIAQQIVDVNGTGEAAGVGLLQIIPSTYEAYRDPELPNNRRDPFSNMVAALRYYKARYGMDLTTMWGKGHGYDQGGIFPHGTWGFNASGLPEAVLTNPQWRLFEQFIRQMPGMEQKLQALPQPVPGQMAPLPQPMNGGTSADGTPGTYGVPVNPGVDTLEMVGNKARERYTSALKTGFDGLISSTLDPLGLPDPRSLIPSEVTEYGKTLDAWHQARIASAQASGALAQSGYQAAPAPAATANQVIQSGGSGTELATYDYSTHITIQTRDVDEGYRKAQQIADLRAIQHTGTARG
ncbi:transglycosylase SLT domain-containing protein [Nocardia farcinica]|uniref:transglycosylase SLT domain-containing protein n=1 Tax=Nocardia farcinica TaxID=37329 RepID=UPI0024554F64|nr:transglycosylase SLT domain-containing protein [Nocardia farcinica]